MSDILQGVTLEVFGEGWSMGPLNDAMKEEMVRRQADIKFDIEWTTLGEYLEYLVERGTSPNVASFVGATSVRIHVLGYCAGMCAHPYKRDLKNLEFHLLDTGHFALEEDGDVMASYMRNFLAKHVGSAVTEK